MNGGWVTVELKLNRNKKKKLETRGEPPPPYSLDPPLGGSHVS